MSTFSLFPGPEEVWQPLSATQLDVLAQQVQAEGPVATIQSKFNYSWGLLKSQQEDNVQLGISLLTGLFKEVPPGGRKSSTFLP